MTGALTYPRFKCQRFTHSCPPECTRWISVRLWRKGSIRFHCKSHSFQNSWGQMIKATHSILSNAYPMLRNGECRRGNLGFNSLFVLLEYDCVLFHKPLILVFQVCAPRADEHKSAHSPSTCNSCQWCLILKRVQQVITISAKWAARRKSPSTTPLLLYSSAVP